MNHRDRRPAANRPANNSMCQMMKVIDALANDNWFEIAAIANRMINAIDDTGKELGLDDHADIYVKPPTIWHLSDYKKRRRFHDFS